MKILLVDDEPMFLRMLKKHLKKISNSLEEAQTFNQANYLVSLQKFDVIICDYCLKDRCEDKTGLELIRIIRGFDQSVVIIAVSGY